MNRLIVIMGVSGAGKSTIGAALAARLSWPFLEGDDFHPSCNVEKMASGMALTNHDREAWIDAMGRAVQNNNNPVLILSCSALNPFVRRRLSGASGRDIDWVYLHLSKSALTKRLRQRVGHFMKDDLLDSQLAALQPPEDAVLINGENSVEDIIEDIQNRLGLHKA